MSLLINTSLTLTLLTAVPFTLDAIQSQPDSQSVLKQLRSEQAKFERVRRRYLPFTHRTYRGDCDEHVGRFCFWHDDDGWRPVPEHSRITAQKDALLAKLESAAIRLPSNEWIAGQRVRYLIESQRYDDALGVVRACQGQGWWCYALEGLVLHNAQEFEPAESAFALAIVAMPEETRAEWNDISLLLEPSAVDQYKSLDLVGKSMFERRFWWFADPFFLTSGNERRTEHYSRLVYNEILAASALTRRMRWGRDNREMLIRYGPTVGWERERSSMSLSSDYRIIGHHQNGGRRFAPSYEYVADPSEMKPGDWELDPFRARTRYATGYARRFAGMQHQLAAFRRGDSAVVVMVARLSELEDIKSAEVNEVSNGDEGEPATIRYWFATNADSQPLGTTAEPDAPVAIKTPVAPTLVSIESVNWSDSVAWRERHWLDLVERLPDGFAVSDLLLLRKSEQLPASLDQAIPLAATHSDVEVGTGITVFFEVYGLRPGFDSLELSLTLAREGKSFVRKAAELLGVVYRSDDRVTMRWSERPVAWTPVTARAVTLQLREDMKGHYKMTLTVRNADDAEAVVFQEVRVTRP